MKLKHYKELNRRQFDRDRRKYCKRFTHLKQKIKIDRIIACNARKQLKLNNILLQQFIFSEIILLIN